MKQLRLDLRQDRQPAIRIEQKVEEELVMPMAVAILKVLRARRKK
jgi:hypothetical protein